MLEAGYWNDGTNSGNQWSFKYENTTNAAAYFPGLSNATVDDGTYTFPVRAEIESNGTSARIRYKSADGLTTYYTSSWLAWSSVRTNSNPLWVVLGDIDNTNSAFSVQITRFQRS
jgi:hypothetical protein